MTDTPGNGTPEQAQARPATLAEVKQIFTNVVLASVKRADGATAIDVREILVNCEIDSCRISAIAECLLAEHIFEAPALQAATIDKMVKRITELQQQIQQRGRLVTALGKLPPANA
jgi:hypothetical protein